MPVKKNLPKPRLKSVNDMFSLSQPGEEFITTISSVEVEKLTPFHAHPFQLYEGERLEDMVASISTNGVMVPIIVRRKDDDVYEILAGHNRTAAAKLAGLSEVPAIILEDISDDVALAYVVETNLVQRSFSEMSHSEKAAVIAMHHSKMFAQGKRNDILAQLKYLEDGDTSSHDDKKLHSGERVAEMYSLSSATVSRYLRINQLVQPLKLLLDSGTIAVVSAVTLSFLPEEHQGYIAQCLHTSTSADAPQGIWASVNGDKANMLRKYSQEGRLSYNLVEEILTGIATPRPVRASTAVKLKNTVYDRYFKPDQPAKEVENIVARALEMYFSQAEVS